jgi:lysozyme
MSYDADALERELTRDEGLRLRPYPDSLGNWTVGIGHLLKPGELHHWPITEAQCMAYLLGDIADAERKLDRILPGWRRYSDVRQRALVNLAFNLGWGLQSFEDFLAAMERDDFPTAGNELVDSKWYRQVGLRGPRIVHMIVTDTPWVGA